MNLTLAKIVGSINGNSWSQVHSFKPEDDKLTTHGILSAAISFKAKAAIDINSFGSEIIQRLQEIYFSHEADSVLKKLSQTIETLAAEWLDQVELEIIAAVYWRDYLYAAKNSTGQVWLKRAGALVGLFSADGLQAVSGKLEPGDTVLAATGQLIELVLEGSLGPVLSQESAEAISESLTAQVYGHEANSRAAAVVIKISQEPKPEPRLPATPILNWLERFRPLLAGLVGLAARFRQVPKPPLFLGKKINLRRRSSLTLMAVLLLVFAASLFLAGKKRQNQEQAQSLQAVIDEVSYKLEEANSLLTLNPLRAKSLLAESNTRIQEYKEKERKPGREILDLEARVNQALEQVQREYAVTAAEWYDFDLIKDGFRGDKWDLAETELLVADSANKTVVRLNLENRSAEVVDEGESLGEIMAVGLTNDRGFIIAPDKVTVVDTLKLKRLAEVEVDSGDWTRITAARGFGSNLYLLDSAVGSQIWKYLGLDDGLSSKKSYLSGESFDLSEAVDMAIDGSVWVLFSDGTIVKYTQGKKDAFQVIGLDQPFGEPVKIFTSPEAERLYVLDRANTRVVVVEKSGEYAAQYQWPGIAGVKSLVVSEDLGKIFFLTGEKIFTVDLR